MAVRASNLNPDFSIASEGGSDLSDCNPGSVFLQANSKGNVKFVDASEHGMEATSARFEKVSAVALPAIISEAVRLTDKKTLLYPWEKGRLGRRRTGKAELEKAKVTSRHQQLCGSSRSSSRRLQV